MARNTYKKAKRAGFHKFHQPAESCGVCSKPKTYKNRVKEKEVVRSQCDCYKCKGLPNCYC